MRTVVRRLLMLALILVGGFSVSLVAPFPPITAGFASSLLFWIAVGLGVWFASSRSGEPVRSGLRQILLVGLIGPTIGLVASGLPREMRLVNAAPEFGGTRTLGTRGWPFVTFRDVSADVVDFPAGAMAANAVFWTAVVALVAGALLWRRTSVWRGPRA